MPSEAKDALLSRIQMSGVVAIMRLNSIDPLNDIAEALLAGGVIAIELTLTTPNAMEGIRRLAGRFGDRAAVGVGTVLDARSCHEAIDAGARFVVSPGFDEAVHATAKQMGALSMPGAMTPTEILRAWTAGADVVKVFPSTVLGPGYFRDVLAPLPHVKLMPTGGVDAENVRDWIKAGAVCVGAGSNLVPKDAVAGRKWDVITTNAQAFVRGVAAARTR